MDEQRLIDTLHQENADLRAAAKRHAEWGRRFARFRSLTARLAASLDRAAIFDEIVQAAAELYNAPAAALLLVDDERQAFVVQAQQGLTHAADTLLPIGRSFAQRALEQRQTIAVEDTTVEPEVETPLLGAGEHPGAMIVAPIRSESQPFGVIEVYYRAPCTILHEDIDLLDAFADAAAIALRNAIAYTRILDQGTELARQNEELARLNNELRRADLLKSQFLSTISHELRTPLTSIIGFSSLLLRRRQGDTLSVRQSDNIERILSSARHLVTLINDILDLSRIEAGRFDVFRREVDLRALLLALCTELEPQAHEKDLTLSLIITEELPSLTSDADRLRQIMINLIGNAIKFTYRGGVIVRVTRSDREVAIAVEDTGIGIAPEQQEHIFDEFYQVDQSSTRLVGGTGLGLAISRRLVDLLEGRLLLRSTPGKGSTFTVIFPLVQERGAIPGVAARSPHGERAARSSGRLLVIDDDPEVTMLLEYALEGTNYTVIGAPSAVDGLAKAQTLQPDAILLDVMMPQTDGWRTLHYLKSDARTAHIPVVMHTIIDDQALGFSLGATDYLIKPVDRAQLLDVLNRLTPFQGGPVLVVDDDENIRSLLSNLLTDDGITVCSAASGIEALQQIDQQLPRLVILELMMPDLDGFAVLQRLRTSDRTRHLPVIVVTAKVLTAEEQLMLEREASMVLTKNGVPLTALLDEVRGAIKVVS